MSTSISDLTFSDLDTEAIAQAEEYLITVLKEEYPSLDLTKSRVIRDQVIRPAAILHVLNREDIDLLRRSFSPIEIAKDPGLADDEYVDSVFSNYRVSRIEGSKASGLISVIISELATTAVPENTIFTANGLDFINEEPFIGVTTADAVFSEAERLIEERSDGSFVFTVPVVATETGEQFRVERSTRFVAVPAIGGVVDLQAAQDFTGGLDEETNAELTERVQSGIAPEVFSGRVQIESLIKDEFKNLQAISQVGYGDQEMLRDRDNIFKNSQGGKADLYVRTASTPEEIRLTKLATFQGNDLWQLTVGRDDAPGFYNIKAVVPKGLTNFIGGLEIDSEVRGLDLTPETDFVQRIEGGLVQGAFSRYQTAIVRFIDLDTPDGLTVGEDTAEYDLLISRIPDIRGINDLTVERGRRPPTGDYLPRAAVPALMSCSLLVESRPEVNEPDVEAIKQAVASRVNGLGFSTGRVQAALIISAAQGAIEPFGSATVTPLRMAATILAPDTVPLSAIFLDDVNELRVPDLPERGVTQRTVNFYLNVNDISIEIKKMDTLSI